MSYPKIFCDIADISVIKKFNKKSIVKGFTTNPSLMRKAGAKNYKNYSKQILRICRKKPISFEVFADNFLEMEKQALKINSWGKNIYVKIPVVNSKGVFMGPVIKKLSLEGIKLNITAVYTFEQVKKIETKKNILRQCWKLFEQAEKIPEKLSLLKTIEKISDELPKIVYSANNYASGLAYRKEKEKIEKERLENLAMEGDES